MSLVLGPLSFAVKRHYHRGVSEMEHQTDVLVVGAGPIGLELAVALKREGVDYVQVDAKQIGYTISWFPPQTRFFSSSDRIAIAGVPLQTPDQNKCTREQYLAYLRMIVEQFDLKVNTYEPVVGIGRQPDGGFVVTTKPAGGERRYRCRRLVLATGGTAKPRKLGIPGEGLPHVCTRLDEPHAYFRKQLLVVGGKNSAIESALRCHNAGAHVSLSYRRQELDAKHVKYWLYPEITHLLNTGGVGEYLGTEPVEIKSSSVVLRNVVSGERVELPTDFVLLQIGYEADMSLCRMAGVELRGEREVPVFDERTMETNVPGVYLAGTVTGGTQDRYKVFIENGHVHTDRIMAALTGHRAEHPAVVYEQPES
jgi:thioredoxin reductase (NADPH)